MDDVQDDARPVTGVMVTTVGYQNGARAVASTYGLVVLELREPSEADWAGRIRSVNVVLTAQVPVVREVRFDAVDVLPGRESGLAALGQVEVDGPSGRVPLQSLLLDGELGALGEPRVPHPVRRAFDPPASLWVEGERVATVRAVEAVVGEVVGPPATVVVDGARDVAWMVRNALTGGGRGSPTTGRSGALMSDLAAAPACAGSRRGGGSVSVWC